jgi:CubicO group peptidase (beta-lactamase class C family)
VAELAVEVDPASFGFDPERLRRLDAHFVRYVDEGLLPGWLILVSRDGKIVHLSTYGERDMEAHLPVETDTLFVLASMSKPVTSVAAMMLYEQGAFELNDPVSRFIPSFGDARVYRQGSSVNFDTEPMTEPMRIWHLLTHTAGLTYGFHYAHPVDALYRKAGFEWQSPKGFDLERCCDTWAGLPLLFQPGREWNYSVATDVLGRVVEVVSGQSLDEFFADHLFKPLGLTETGFSIPESAESRMAKLYVPAPGTRRATLMDNLLPGGGARATRRPTMLSGGGGLIGTAGDYHRFTQMLLNKGELDGTRLLGSRTVDYMTKNHLPGNADLETIGRPLFAETTFDGIGFGLGFSVVLDPAKNKVLSAADEYAWGGAASTAFFVDPTNRITSVFMTQLMPSSTHPIRPQLRQLIYQALVD